MALPNFVRGPFYLTLFAGGSEPTLSDTHGSTTLSRSPGVRVTVVGQEPPNPLHPNWLPPLPPARGICASDVFKETPYLANQVDTFASRARMFCFLSHGPHLATSPHRRHFFLAHLAHRRGLQTLDASLTLPLHRHRAAPLPLPSTSTQ